MLWLIVKVVSRVSSTTTKPLEDAMVCYGEAVRNFLVTWSSGFVARTPKAGHRNIHVDGSLQAGIGEGSLELQFKSIPTLWRIEALCHSLYQPNTNAVITTKKSLTKYCGHSASVNADRHGNTAGPSNRSQESRQKRGTVTYRTIIFAGVFHGRRGTASCLL